MRFFQCIVLCLLWLLQPYWIVVKGLIRNLQGLSTFNFSMKHQYIVKQTGHEIIENHQLGYLVDLPTCMSNSQAGLRGTSMRCSKETCHLVFSVWKVYSEMLLCKRTRTARICFPKYREKTNKQTWKTETCKSLLHLCRPQTLEMCKIFSYFSNC